MSLRSNPEKGRTHWKSFSLLPQTARQLLGLFPFQRRGQSTPERLFLPARLIIQERDQVRLALGGQPLQFGEGDLGFLAFGAQQSDHGLGGALGGVVKEALIDMADLLDAQPLEAQPDGRISLAFALQVLQGAQQVQHCAVVDRQRRGRLLPPVIDLPPLLIDLLGRPSRKG